MLPKAKAEVNLNIAPVSSITKTFSIAWDRKKLNPLNNKRVRRLVLNFLNTEPSYSISKTFSIAWDIKKSKPSKQQARAALSAQLSQH